MTSLMKSTLLLNLSESLSNSSIFFSRLSSLAPGGGYFFYFICGIMKMFRSVFESNYLDVLKVWHYKKLLLTGIFAVRKFNALKWCESIHPSLCSCTCYYVYWWATSPQDAFGSLISRPALPYNFLNDY